MILADFTCPRHGRFEMLVAAADEWASCPERMDCCDEHMDWCGEPSPWSPSPVRGRVRIAEVQRGGVDKPDSPMYLNTRELGEGMPYDEWKAKREKVYQERRHAESKDL